MNDKFYRLLPVAAMLLLGACGSSSNQQGSGDDSMSTDAPVVSSRVSNSNPVIGARIEIVLGLENFPATEGGGVSVSFDPTVLQVENVEIDPAWDFAMRSGVIDNQAGTVTDILFTSFSSPAGSVNIATITATVVGAGVNPISIVESPTSPFAAAGQRFAVEFESSTIEVN